MRYNHADIEQERRSVTLGTKVKDWKSTTRRRGERRNIRGTDLTDDRYHWREERV